MKKPTVKITMKYHPNRTLGEKYEVVKLVNAVVVRYEDPADRHKNLTVRVSDTIAEAHADALKDIAEVTIIPE